MAVAAVMVVSLMSGFVFTASAASTGATHVNQSHMLKVKGNKLVWEDDESVEVVLSGVNLPGGEWTGTPGSEKIDRNIKEAMDNWHCNVVRLAVGTKGWNGGYDYQSGNYNGYRNFIDKVIDEAEKRGKYVILDLHEYGIFDATDLAFWKEAATRYKNNPAVLFGILNEPTPASWDIWLNGDNSGKIGHQKIVETIPDLGAKNIIVAGGLDWGYDLRGIVGEAEDDDTIYALVDQGSGDNKANTGYGIAYDSHIYPWKGRTPDWDKMMGTARRLYPIISGENGWDNNTIKSVEGAEYPETSEKWYTIWAPEYFDFVNDEETYGSYLNWTGWCFHPYSSPRIIDERFKDDNYDYSYLPTDYWGVYVQEEMNKQFGENLLTNAEIVSYFDDIATASLATDGADDTIWVDNFSGDSVYGDSKFIEYKLDDEYMIDTWAIRHSGASNYREVEQLKNTVDFTVKVSTDGKNWTTLEHVTNNTVPVTERHIKPVAAKYVRFEFNKLNYEGTNELRIRELFVTGQKPEVVIDGEMTVERENDKAQLSIPVNVESSDNQLVTVMVATFNDDLGMDKSKAMLIENYKFSGKNDIKLTYDLPKEGQYVRVIVFNSADEITAYKFE